MSVDDRLYQPGLVGKLKPTAKGLLHAEFVVPPLSVLDARAGYWQDRKKRWIALGIKSEVGRGDNLMNYGGGATLGDKDTSIFDPVVAELAYRWWSPAGGSVLDPFAGGSVRGIVAGVLGRRYLGLDLRAEQVEANRQQAEEIGPEKRPRWIVRDSTVPYDFPIPRGGFDFVFSCPPYGSLEKYSNDPRDLSNLEYKDFAERYIAAIWNAGKALAQDRFAAFVVANYRDPKRGLIDLVGGTVAAFGLAGLKLYNEAILATAISTASLRARRIFNGHRKLAKVHQNVLVFCKGDPERAAEACKDGLAGTPS